MSKLIRPSFKYKASFAKGIKEYAISGDFKKEEARIMLEKIKNPKEFIRNKNPKKFKGYVPLDHYWLIDKNEYIGGVNIRHKLNKDLKQYGGHIGSMIRPSKR